MRAPEHLELPEGPEKIRWRSVGVDDAALITELYERISRRDHPSWSESVDEVAEELGHSWVDAARDGVLAFDENGELVAHGLVVVPPDPESLVRVWLFGGVDPAHRGRGIGRVLLAWQHGRALQKLAEVEQRLPAWVMSYASDRAPEHGALLRHAGFEAARWFTTLECDLAQPTPARAVPERLIVEPFTSERSEAVRSAKNAAFADHWGSQPSGREQWESMQSLPSFRPELSRLALDGDEVAGFVVTEINEEDWPRLGARSAYIGLVGTVRRWRGKGLAAALLADVLHAYRDADLERAVLDVDTENPTGALGVYTKLGFAPTARDVAYRIEV